MKKLSCMLYPTMLWGANSSATFLIYPLLEYLWPPHVSELQTFLLDQIHGLLISPRMLLCHFRILYKTAIRIFEYGFCHSSFVWGAARASASVIFPSNVYIVIEFWCFERNWIKVNIFCLLMPIQVWVEWWISSVTSYWSDKTSPLFFFFLSLKCLLSYLKVAVFRTTEMFGYFLTLW